MFETIIGHDPIITQLKNDVIKKTLSHSMIFHGDPSIGKLTAALELVRVMNCEYDSTSDCHCNHCKSIHSLDFKGLIFLSRRDFTYYIKEFSQSYLETQNMRFIPKIHYYLKLMLLPLQDFLIQDALSETDKKSIGSITENIQNFLFKKEMPTSKDLENICQSASKIADIYKKPNIPVDQMRAMLDWTYISQPDFNRCIIIDQADLLEESSRNILLKRLEEPSDNLFFILLAVNKNRIIQTIQSRCRSYYFRKVKKLDLSQILKSCFSVDILYNSVNEFLHRGDENSRTNLYTIIDDLFSLTLNKDRSMIELLDLIQKLNDRKKVKALLDYLSEILQSEIYRRESGKNNEHNFKILNRIADFHLKELISLINDRYHKIESFNLNPVITLEGIFCPLKSMVMYDQI
jgi:DNA polymerase-3 subunit gamma/tau